MKGVQLKNKDNQKRQLSELGFEEKRAARAACTAPLPHRLAHDFIEIVVKNKKKKEELENKHLSQKNSIMKLSCIRTSDSKHQEMSGVSTLGKRECASEHVNVYT